MNLSLSTFKTLNFSFFDISDFLEFKYFKF